MKTDETLKEHLSEPKVRSIAEVLAGTEGVVHLPLLPMNEESGLALDVLRIPAASSADVRSEGKDSVLFLMSGEAEVVVSGERRMQSAGAATLLVDGAEARISTQGGEAVVVQFIVDVQAADTHAALGPREIFSSIDLSDPQSATSSRSYGVIFGPENGSLHATLFAGLVPVGAAPWHFHQYDEIVLIVEGVGLFHHADTVSPVGPGSAFHIPARDLHINENTSTAESMLLLGFLTPAGSPSAAYLPKA